MSISFPLGISAFWENVRFAGRPEFELLQYKQQSMDGGGNILSAKFGQPKWRADVATANGRHDADMNIQAMIKLLTGRDGKFLAYDIRRPFPLSDPGGAMLANGSIVSIGGEAASGNVVFGTYRYESVSVTRAQAVSMVSDAGTYFDADGVLQTAAANAVRVDYGPFANYVQNFKGTGAVAGSPGTVPTGWSVNAPAGLTRTITLETIDGLPYVRFRFQGTVSSTGPIQVQQLPLAAAAPAVFGQTWVYSQFLQILNGIGLTGNDWRMELWEYNGVPSFLGGSGTALSIPSTVADAAPVRRSYSKAMSLATTAYTVPIFRVGNITAGTVCDIELRVGAPLLNQGSVALDYPRVPLGMLVETATANKLLRSREFDNAAWTKARATVTPNIAGVVDPWGTALADKMAEDSTPSISHLIQQGYIVTNYVRHVEYVIARAAERTKIRLSLTNNTADSAFAVFDLVAGTYNSLTSGTGDLTGAAAQIISLGNGWYWCELSALKIAGDPDCVTDIRLLDSSGSAVYTGDGTSGIYLAHAQLEEGTTGHMPIVTTTTAVSRVADLPTFSALGTNDFVLTYDDGSTTIHNARVGNWFPNIANLARPRIRKWTATRVTPPSAAAMKIKTKGSDNRSLSLKALPPFYALSVNDKLSVLDGAGRYALLEVMEAVTANIAGDTAEFEVQPFLPTWLAVNQVVNLAKPLGKFQILAGSYKPSTVSGNRSSGASFSMISVP